MHSHPAHTSARELLLYFWCCCAEGLHGEVGEMVNENVIYTWNVSDTNIVVAFGS